MTTIVVVRKGDRAALAADSLTTFGSTRLAPYYDRSPHKIIAYRDSFIGVAGSAAHQLVLENLLSRNPDLAFHGKDAIYETFRKLHPCSRTRRSSTRRKRTTTPTSPRR